MEPVVSTGCDEGGGMASGAFIGDHSVQWEILADNVRPGTLVNAPNGIRGHRHGGIDETDDTKDQWFTVTIQRPRTGWSDETIAAIQSFIASRGAVLTFRIPIEDQNYLMRHGVTPPTPGNTPQINVSWASRSSTQA
jgi:hypothetical protein